jgi:hypothetical protein
LHHGYRQSIGKYSTFALNSCFRPLPSIEEEGGEQAEMGIAQGPHPEALCRGRQDASRNNGGDGRTAWIESKVYLPREGQ